MWSAGPRYRPVGASRSAGTSRWKSYRLSRSWNISAAARHQARRLIKVAASPSPWRGAMACRAVSMTSSRPRRFAASRRARTVAAMYLERRVEPVFHPDSYGYRPGRSALDAVEQCQRRLSAGVGDLACAGKSVSALRVRCVARAGVPAGHLRAVLRRCASGVWPDIGEPADPVLFCGLVGSVEVSYLAPPAIMVIALAVVELAGRTA